MDAVGERSGWDGWGGERMRKTEKSGERMREYKKVLAMRAQEEMSTKVGRGWLAGIQMRTFCSAGMRKDGSGVCLGDCSQSDTGLGWWHAGGRLNAGET